MQIIIKYEASWQNSFLDGSNNEPLPKNGRKFIASNQTLSDPKIRKENFPFIKRSISFDTVMGVLNRLIGDQRKLYQARECPEYFFADIEKNNQIKFENIHDRSKPLNSEIVYIRNMNGSEDKKSFTGMIKSNDPIFSSDYSNQLWGILTLDFDTLCDFIINPNFIVKNEIKFDPLSIVNQFEKLGKLKNLEITDKIQQSVLELQNRYQDIKYTNDKGAVKPIAIYCSAMYLQILRLGKRFDLSSVLTKNGLISGIAKSGFFTPKDFMDRFTTGNKKLIWGNPYILKEKRKGEGEVVSTLTKANGILEINLEISKEKSLELEEMIQNAGVSSFYLGKKGLAYVEDIRI